MDSVSTIKELRDLVAVFCAERDWLKFHNAKDLSIGISTEANELLQMFRFKSEADMKEMLESDKIKQISDEIADVLYFILLFSEKTGIDLTFALKEKLKKNNEKYSIKQCKGTNRKYNE